MNLCLSTILIIASISKITCLLLAILTWIFIILSRRMKKVAGSLLKTLTSLSMSARNSSFLRMIFHFFISAMRWLVISLRPSMIIIIISRHLVIIVASSMTSMATSWSRVFVVLQILSSSTTSNTPSTSIILGLLCLI